MGLLDRFKKQLPQDADGSSPDISYQLNEFSIDARRRSDIFIKLARQQGLEVLTGRYGGEYNNDMLAAGDNNG
jgi:hypothetical protein